MVFGVVKHQVVDMIIVGFKWAFFVPNPTEKHTTRIQYRHNKNTKSSHSHKGFVRNKNEQNHRIGRYKIHGKQVKQKP